VLLKISKYYDGRPPYLQIASELYLSPSRVHASVKRAKLARLLHGTELSKKPNYVALEQFLIHGVKYAFPAVRGELSRGVPTGHSAPPLNESIVQADASVLARLVDGVLLVVRSKSTPSAMAQKARQELRKSNIVGVVLNAVEEVDSYGGTYSYGYGYGEKKAKTGRNGHPRPLL